VVDIGFGVKLKVWGDYACFTRPEMKVERVSYDVMTPSAARGILEAIYWKPAIVWEIDRIHVMKPVKFDNVRRNEVKDKIPVVPVRSAFKGNDEILSLNSNERRVQRASLLLRNVEYYIEAHFNKTNKAGPDDTVEKHYNVALRRMRKGQCFHQPYFGCREFPARFEFVEGEIPPSTLKGDQDLGLMLWDIDFAQDMKAIFFRPTMHNGIIDVRNSKERGAFS